MTDPAALATLARARLHRPGMLHAGIALRLSDPRIESVGEEFDGRVKYGRVLRRDQSLAEVVELEKRREEEIGRLTGWRCVRIVWADLDHPVQTAYRIRSMFRAATPATDPA